ncbi:C-X-C motif chemokine 16 isoform X1 [Rousettus aegyptiacus]|uniref:C-X-C motif chemokine 16 n=2 Tax=Rousettus aegyptiacus TaxID=9407 RepID=A0A7J8G6R0_ROUAE|nr:C-X-C motif chemokine 16 isoform X1 [Rousettus aegyptiacus]KAF6455558.1 C-X-C motif chemokine ligand 16 [Rousettus aegyptiacus]
MWKDGRPLSLRFLFLLLAWLTPLGYGNEGSSTGSCYCNTRFSSDSPTVSMIEHLRKHLKHYDQCTSYIRFHLHSRTVCGGSKEKWVTELVSCFNRTECGHHYYRRVVHPEHLPPPSTQVPELTKRSSSDVGTPAQRYLPPNLLPSTQQPTLPAERLSLDKNLTHANETSTSSVGDSLEAGENQKQKKENMGPTAEISVIVPVLSLLAIVFILTGVLLYVLCKRRMQSLQYPPDLQFHYIPVTPDSNASTKNGSS